MPISIKRSFHRFLVSTFLVLTVLSPLWSEEDPKLSNGIRTVVIDPGHGGKDPGAIGKRAKEKDIVLPISLKLGKYIEDNLPDVKVIYTRKTDVFPELIERARIANEAEADLFISIHVNALDNKPHIHGTLTLVLGQHRADENFDVAVRENSVILLEEDYETTYEGFDPKSAESYIMFNLMQKTYFKQSIEFGDFVQDQFRERARRHDLGVREQGILVLARTSMPGVLVETGFITNEEEEKYLMSDYGQDIIASAIYRAFKEYKEEIDRRSNMSVVRREPDSEKFEREAYRENPVIPGAPLFSIQLASSRSKTDTGPAAFKGYQGVRIVEDGRWFKYIYGRENNYQRALNLCTEVKKDFPDAFVVALKNEKIIPLGDALKEMNR